MNSEDTPDTSLFELRGITDDDHAFIFSNWLRGLYYGNAMLKELSWAKFQEFYRAYLTHTLKHHLTKKQILCLKEDPSVVIGFAFSSADTLQGIYIKKAWRGLKLSHLLLGKSCREVKQLMHATNKTNLYFPNAVLLNPFQQTKGNS